MLDAIDRGEGSTIYGDGARPSISSRSRIARAANVCAMRADAADRFYNVGTGKRTSLKEVAEKLLRSDRLGRSRSTTRPQQATLVRNRIGSPERPTEEIGFQARVSISTTDCAADRVARTHTSRGRERRAACAERRERPTRYDPDRPARIGEEEWQAVREPLAVGLADAGPEGRRVRAAFAERHGSPTRSRRRQLHDRRCTWRSRPRRSGRATRSSSRRSPGSRPRTRWSTAARRRCSPTSTRVTYNIDSGRRRPPR